LPFLGGASAFVVVAAGLIAQLIIFFLGGIADLATQFAQVLAHLLGGFVQVCSGTTGLAGITDTRHDVTPFDPGLTGYGPPFTISLIVSHSRKSIAEKSRKRRKLRW